MHDSPGRLGDLRVVPQRERDGRLGEARPVRNVTQRGPGRHRVRTARLLAWDLESAKRPRPPSACRLLSNAALAASAGRRTGFDQPAAPRPGDVPLGGYCGKVAPRRGLGNAKVAADIAERHEALQEDKPAQLAPPPFDDVQGYAQSIKIDRVLYDRIRSLAFYMIGINH